MFKKVKLSKEIVREIEQKMANEIAKQEALKVMQKEGLNYQIIQDLINSATQRVKIEITLADGSKLSIKPETPFEMYQDGLNY